MQLSIASACSAGQTLGLQRRLALTLALLRAAETFLPIITSSTTLGSPTASLVGYGVEPISRILAVEFYCLTSSAFDGAGFASTEADFLDDPSSYQASSSRAEPLEHPCNPIRKILSGGGFYYSPHFDISTRLEVRQAREAEKASEKGKEVESDEFDSRFMWNSFLVAPLLKFRASLSPSVRDLFDRQAFVVLCIQGYAGTYSLSLGGQPAVLSLISRLGWKRAGTRFNVRCAASSRNDIRRQLADILSPSQRRGRRGKRCQRCRDGVCAADARDLLLLCSNPGLSSPCVRALSLTVVPLLTLALSHSVLGRRRRLAFCAQNHHYSSARGFPPCLYSPLRGPRRYLLQHP